MWTTNGTEVKLETKCPLGRLSPVGFPALFSPAGNRLVLWCGRRAEIFDLEGHRLVRMDAVSSVLRALWSPDGSVLATGHADGTLWLWRDTGEAWLRLPAHPLRWRSVEWSADGRSLLTAGGDGTVRIWPLMSHEALQAYARDAVPAVLGEGEQLRYADLLEP
jgi:WD40 repeat protein